ncbi:hypothetical protein EIP86_003846 [Pleurotus ostreatoroseus]|nr:hypothetical protein EIP86_003846 [Pleurotus ostreatoroseus]
MSGGSQQDQDKYDAQTKKKVMKELISTWMDRLQLISVITTFFAAIEAQLLSVVTPDNKDQVPGIGQAASVTLACSLVVHVFAAILSFIAAFFLVRFRLNEAAREELKVERVGNAKRSLSPDFETFPGIFSSNPHLEPVGPFRKGQPPTHLLERCHTISMFLALIGFILALVGVLCYVWYSLPFSAGVASSLCVGVCVTASLVAVFSKTVDPMPKNKFTC